MRIALFCIMAERRLVSLFSGTTPRRNDRSPFGVAHLSFFNLQISDLGGPFHRDSIFTGLGSSRH